MSQLSRVAKVLRRNQEYPGVTTSFISKMTGVPKDSVHKRIYDLRTLEGKTIYSNTRKYRGRNKTYYRFAG